MPFQIRRKRFPVRIRRTKFALHGASLTGAEAEEDASQLEWQGRLTGSEQPCSPWTLVSEDDGKDDTEEEKTPRAGEVPRDNKDLNVIIFTLAGPSILASYFKVEPRKYALPDWRGYDWHLDEQGAIEEEQEPEILGMGEDISKEEYIGFLDVLPAATGYVDQLLRLDMKQRVELCERHAQYRIKACKLLRGDPVSNFDDATLKRMYPPKWLKKNEYFKCYEKDGSFGWFFHPDHCQLAALDDYQRLVPRNGRSEYMDWDGYRLNYHTHEIDWEYVRYFETMSREIRWIDDHVVLDLTCREEWFKLRNRAARQAMKVATRFTNISAGLAHLAFMEYISSLHHSLYNSKDLDGVFFEIWKCFIKQQMSFRKALEEVYELNKFPLRQCFLKYELERDCSEFERHFCSCMADITDDVSEDTARRMIAKRVRIMFKAPKRYDEYARKKLKIAELIGLIPRHKKCCLSKCPLDLCTMKTPSPFSV